jgi:hypothetical protein
MDTNEDMALSLSFYSYGRRTADGLWTEASGQIEQDGDDDDNDEE